MSDKCEKCIEARSGQYAIDEIESVHNRLLVKVHVYASGRGEGENQSDYICYEIDAREIVEGKPMREYNREENAW